MSFRDRRTASDLAAAVTRDRLDRLDWLALEAAVFADHPHIQEALRRDADVNDLRIPGRRPETRALRWLRRASTAAAIGLVVVPSIHVAVSMAGARRISPDPVSVAFPTMARWYAVATVVVLVLLPLRRLRVRRRPDGVDVTPLVLAFSVWELAITVVVALVRGVRDDAAGLWWCLLAPLAFALALAGYVSRGLMFELPRPERSSRASDLAALLPSEERARLGAEVRAAVHGLGERGVVTPHDVRSAFGAPLGELTSVMRQREADKRRHPRRKRR